jgi:hypothetical protein
MIGPKEEKPTAREQREAYELVEVRDGGVCQWCRRNECGPIQIDHRRNRSQGGLTVIENLQALGLRHHVEKTEHPDAANSEGHGVPGWAEPADYPARRWLRSTVGTVRLGQVLYLPADLWADGPGFREIGEMEAATRRAGLWAPP